MQWSDGRLFCGRLHCRVCGEWVLDAPLAYNGVVDECFKFSITMLLNSTIMLMIVLHYASICSYASILLLCSKLCQHNSPRPNSYPHTTTSFNYKALIWWLPSVPANNTHMQYYSNQWQQLQQLADDHNILDPCWPYERLYTLAVPIYSYILTANHASNHF